MILSNNVFADEGHGIVKFKGEVISAPCSIKPGDEDLTVNLGEVRFITEKRPEIFG